MTRSRRWDIAILLLVILGWSRDGAACSCFPSGPPCEAAGQADAVFVGTVRSMREPQVVDGKLTDYFVVVTFDVERSFRGAVSRQAHVITGLGAGDCGYRFESGRKYIVYARQAAWGRYSTGICSRTRPVERADDDLRYFTTMAGARGARVYGRVTHVQRDPFEARAVDRGPLPGVMVRLRRPGCARDALTDASGRYEFTGLDPGTMTVTVMTPPGFRLDGNDRQVKLVDPRGCSLQDFPLAQVAEASGTIVDPSGDPIPGVLVDAVAEELATHRPYPYQPPVETDAQGKFRFDNLPPGRYVFGVNLTRKSNGDSGPAVFFPGTSDPKEAMVIELQPDDRRDLGVMRRSPAR